MKTNYQNYLNSTDWKIKRKLKYSKKKRCAICSSTEKLNVHHLNYRNLFDVSQSDLRILCERCHHLTHKLFKEGKFKFRNDNHNSRFTIIKSAVKKELGLTKLNMFTTNHLTKQQGT